MDHAKTIVIVGGGFAGTTLARALDGKLPPGYRARPHQRGELHDVQPDAARGASARRSFRSRSSLRSGRCSRGPRFVMGRVSAIDPARKTLTAATLAGEITLPYEHLVLAFGNRARLDLIPGLAENALPLKTIGDAMHIRNMVLRRVAQIELETDPAVRRRLGHFVVIGGGFSGVETAGELADCLAGILRYYPRVATDELKVTLLQDQPRLLPELSERLGVAAHRSLAARGVDVRTGTRATCVGARAVALAGGEMLHAATDDLHDRHAAQRAGRADDDSGRARPHRRQPRPLGARHARALGDRRLRARHRMRATASSRRRRRSSRCARRAMLAANLLAVLAGGPTRAFDYQARGSMAAIGHRKGVADVFGIPLWGLPAWLLWRAYYLSQMPTLGRKLRIFVEWTWGMFFPTDITHLRFTRSHEIDETAAAAAPTRNRRRRRDPPRSRSPDRSRRRRHRLPGESVMMITRIEELLAEQRGVRRGAVEAGCELLRQARRRPASGIPLDRLLGQPRAAGPDHRLEPGPHVRPSQHRQPGRADRHEPAVGAAVRGRGAEGGPRDRLRPLRLRRREGGDGRGAPRPDRQLAAHAEGHAGVLLAAARAARRGRAVSSAWWSST